MNSGRHNGYQRASTVKLGEHRGRPRIYLQGKWLARGNFKAGDAITAEFGERVVTLRHHCQGDRVVSGKKGGTIPVIDLNTEQLSTALAGAETLQVRIGDGQITITACRTEAKRASRVRNGKVGALFAGGGFLTQAAKQAGYVPTWAIEWDERYAEIYERNHPTARMFNQSVSEVDLTDLEPVELLTVPIPCEPFSTKRRDPAGRAGENRVPEAHELGDMVFWALRIIDHLNPDKVVVEEVPGFLASGAGCILVSALKRMGYCVETRVVDSTDYNALTRRRRAVIVATSQPVEWPTAEPHTARVADALDEGGAWFDASSKSWLFDHWAKQEAKGNNFSNQKFSAEDPCIGAVGKRYFSQQGDGVVIRHPEKADTYRWLTLDEVKRMHGVPVDYYLGDAKTTAGEIIGQSVVVPVFEKIIRAVGAAGRI